jgi:hypothetical protein
VVLGHHAITIEDLILLGMALVDEAEAAATAAETDGED